jgi:hypothetical protein
MKYIILIFLTLVFFGCKQKESENAVLQMRLDSLELKLANTYKPGFGEFMSGIQAHHSKLWFAAQNQNWKLADFEIHEIMEAVDNIKKFETDRKESKMIEMIDPVLDTVNNAVRQKNTALFKQSYVLLTNTCNKCHLEASFEFNVIKIPDHQFFSNQDFKVPETK